MNSLGTSHHRDELVIEGSSVAWFVDDGLVHKRTFNFDDDGQPIAQALFAVFPSPQTPQQPQPQHSSSTSSTALVVVLKTLMHIIFLDGGSYIVHLPFPVVKVWSASIGLLLERQLDSTASDYSAESEAHLPRLFTLSSPLEDFGMVTCNRSSQLDSNEEIAFVSSQLDTFCVTTNIPEKRLTLWYASPDQQARRKVPHS
jgi:hypothetical protein